LTIWFLATWVAVSVNAIFEKLSSYKSTSEH
jgi:hypothetical protein